MRFFTKKKYLFLFIALCSACFLFWASFIEPSRLTETRLKIPIDSWAKTKNHVRVVALADFHLARGVREERRLARIVKKTLELKPDIVVLLGDYVNGTQREKMMSAEKIAAGLSPLARSVPVFACLGNHDGFYGNDKIIEAFTSVGIEIGRKAVKEVVVPNKTMSLQIVIALDPDSFGATTDIFPSFSPASAGTPTILLAHSPDVFILLEKGETSGFSFDFALCGHTHGGQVCLPGGFPIVSSTRLVGLDFAYGLKEFSTGSKMFVSRGLGTSILPVRLFCPPEIVIADLIPAE